jgi:hypothetical protein
MTDTENIRLLVRMGSDRSIVGMGRNRLLKTGLFLTWFVAETIQHHNVVLERLELFVYCGPVRIKLKWSVPINEYNQSIVKYGRKKSF